jgi:hypothetical protein
MKFILKESQNEELIAQGKNVEKSVCTTQFFIDMTTSVRMTPNAWIVAAYPYGFP